METLIGLRSTSDAPLGIKSAGRVRKVSAKIAINCCKRTGPMFFRATPPRPELAKFACRVLGSGEWGPAVMAAIEESVPRAVQSGLLYKCFGSRGDGDLAGKVLSARRYKFGSREEKAAARQGAV